MITTSLPAHAGLSITIREDWATLDRARRGWRPDHVDPADHDTGWDAPWAVPTVTLNGLAVPMRYQVDVRHETDQWEAALLYGVSAKDQQVVLVSVESFDLDADAALTRLRSARPMKQWKKLAFSAVAQQMARQDGNNFLFNTESGHDDDGPPIYTPAYHSEERRLVAEAAVTADRSRLTRRRYTFIDDEKLREVASVYRAAHQAGEPPTKAVAAAMTTSYSNAATLVRRARQVGALGPAGSRGGELHAPTSVGP